MNQSKAWIMATLGVLALSACGTQPIPTITSETKVINDNTNGGGNGGNGGNGDSRIPTGPTGNLTGNVDFRLSKADAKLLRGIIEGLSAGNGPVGVLGTIVGFGKALSPELNNGTQGCDAGGTYTSNSTGGDADKDGIPATAHVTFTKCKYNFNTNGTPGTVELNGTLDLEDHHPNTDDNSFLFVADLQASGSGSLNIGGTVINLNTTAHLNIGLDIINKSSSYDIDFGVKLVIDGKTLDARLDATVVPNNTNDYGAGGVITLAGKVGLSEDGVANTIIGFSSAGLTYDRACTGAINGGALTITDGVHNLVITQKKCGYTEAKLDGNFIDL
jgi:hypothetical protein